MEFMHAEKEIDMPQVYLGILPRGTELGIALNA